MIGPISNFIGLKNYFGAPSSIFGEEIEETSQHQLF